MVALIGLIIGSLPQLGAAAPEKQALIAELVRNLGYGGAIHDFKNYVLRGKDKYRADADAHFNQARQTITALRETALRIEDVAALDELERVINAYQTQLPTIKRIFKRERSLARALWNIGKKVNVDDQAAIAALSTLRGGYQKWSGLEEFEYLIGYGGAIHAYKDYLIRRDDSYRAHADAQFTAAKKTLDRVRNQGGLSKADARALADIDKVLTAYQDSLPVIQHTFAPLTALSSDLVISITTRGADRAIKVSDTTAIRALARLDHASGDNER